MTKAGVFRLCLLLVCVGAEAAAAELETLTVQPGQWLVYEHDDPGVTLEMAVDGGVLEPVTGGFAAPAQGTHWVTLVARHPVGHRSALRWILLQVAAPPTSVSFEFEPPGAADAGGGRWVAANAAATVRVEGSRPDYDLTRLRVGDELIEESDGAFRTSIAASEETTLVLEGVDRNGDAHEIRALPVRVDSRPPEMQLQVANGSVCDGSSVLVGSLPAHLTVSAEDEGAGVEGVEWSPDGRSWAPVDGELAVADAELYLRAFDRAGNLSERRVTIGVDVDAPVIRVISARSGSAVTGGGRLLLQRGDEVEFTAEDEGSGVDRARYRVGEGPWIDLPATVPLSREGSTTLELEAWDRAGNHRLDHYKVRVRITGDGGQS